MSHKSDGAHDTKVWVVAALALVFLSLLTCIAGGTFLIFTIAWRDQPLAENAPPQRKITEPPGKNPLKGDNIDLADARLNGSWSGAYHYPEAIKRKPVPFDIKITQAGKSVSAFTKEPNTFGKKGEPRLYANCRGTFDSQTGNVTWTKTYDGTAGVRSSAEYRGQLSPDSTQIDGTWTIRGEGQPDFGGSFTLQKLNGDKKEPDKGP